MNKRKSGVAYGRITLLALAAMSTARLLLLMIDIIQARVGGWGGEIAIPFYIVLIFGAGWKLREWTAKIKAKEKKSWSGNTPVRNAGATLTQGSPATARRKTPPRQSAKS